MGAARTFHTGIFSNVNKVVTDEFTVKMIEIDKLIPNSENFGIHLADCAFEQFTVIFNVVKRDADFEQTLSNIEAYIFLK
ncbi:hypothetical protein FACS1894188_08920 [Clostridia bacterium]|nr:hypothetical protein FACS1894188_08920 [Clostridia bacterium]